MPVQKKSLIGNTVAKKAQTVSQEQPQANDLKANSLAAHSMKKKKGGLGMVGSQNALTLRAFKSAAYKKA